MSNSDYLKRDIGKPLNIAIFISGTGSNMVAIVNAISSGQLNAKISCVVSSNDKAKGIQKAKDFGIKTIVYKPQDYVNVEALESTLAEVLHSMGVEYICLAGYMRKISPVLLSEFPNRIINLHPALLPSFPGAHGIDDAFNAGVKVTGITLHFANEVYDEGPILHQIAVPIDVDDNLDSLETKIHKQEHIAYPYLLQKLAENKIIKDNGIYKIVD
ncbi:MAG: phosphoribosylglycinamide formyltransferase [Coriobacteriales bacterium]|nr:phosphoribosylglycinamide formyltransferase [Coriobacteriales bacterium]